MNKILNDDIIEDFGEKRKKLCIFVFIKSLCLKMLGNIFLIYY